MLTARRARKLLAYNSETGELTWRRRKEVTKYDKAWNTRWAGKSAASMRQDGYARTCVDYTRYQTHRLVWLIMTGKWPRYEIDHINMERSDNRWCNLREATKAQNQMNTNQWSTNTSGDKGVDWHSRTKKWRARITIARRSITLGYFSKKQDAVAARREAATSLHPQFARH